MGKISSLSPENAEHNFLRPLTMSMEIQERAECSHGMETARWRARRNAPLDIYVFLCVTDADQSLRGDDQFYMCRYLYKKHYFNTEMDPISNMFY